MKKTEQKYQTYVEILKEELIPAMGCTEPLQIRLHINFGIFCHIIC